MQSKFVCKCVCVNYLFYLFTVGMEGFGDLFFIIFFNFAQNSAVSLTQLITNVKTDITV